MIVGFTAAGDVVVNDPAARTPCAGPPHLRPRPVRERLAAALPDGGGLRGSGGLAYVIRDAAHPLPARTAGAPW